MPGILVIGDEQKRIEYVDALIAEYAIPKYNITRYDLPLKIADVRSLIKSLSFGSNKNRLIVISNSPTIECQNALLKTLEELPESIFIILSLLDMTDILSTVQSRCQIKSFAVTRSSSTDEELRSIVQSFIKELEKNDNYSNILSFAEKYDTLSKKDYRNLVLSFRQELLDMQKNIHNKRLIANMALFVRTLNKQYELIEKNNMNERFTLENSF